MPIGHRLAKKKRITPRDLVKEDFIAFGEGSHTRSNTDAVFRKAGLAPTVVLDASVAPTVCELVAAGLGVPPGPYLLMASVRGLAVVRPFDRPTPFYFLLCDTSVSRNMDIVHAFPHVHQKTAKTG